MGTPRKIFVRKVKRIDRYMRYVYRLIKRNEYIQRCKHGAVIVKGGSIIATGVNTLKYYNPDLDILTSVHAEISAIKKVKNKEKLRGSKMYVGRLACYGPAQSCPCDNCKKVILEFGIRDVYYTTANGWERMKLAHE